MAAKLVEMLRRYKWIVRDERFYPDTVWVEVQSGVDREHCVFGTVKGIDATVPTVSEDRRVHISTGHSVHVRVSELN